ncbi:hypothetical protein AGDE_06752 [Angomonas deanei]|uniref:Uncharacterized protein n=1 Tax=Angomonas deanei TaxID=59799 RepID=A0A7G2CRA5_9TRYP|nr:hypothetical protein AGDE_06752 [Angomonas deanei]CAD2221514.1 hypothetical protein, conserved [Angomonas deanei]|eukprot:EPY36768.1 hypothetical protein AGDE_06752 [Angomonas deanei]
MLRRSFPFLVKGSRLFADTESNKKQPITTEVGEWLYKKETMDAFQSWCRTHDVRAYGNIKMTANIHYARCLRATRTFYPGEGIITCPASSCFNFLTVAKEMFDTPSHCFPLPLDWMNYNKVIPWLPSRCTHEIAFAGWFTRIASLQESPFSPYILFLLEDTRGKVGISSGMSKEKDDESGIADHYLSEIATDACEEPEVFLDNFFVALACLFHRTQPIEKELIEYYIQGTNFFKAKAAEMHVPTLIPLADCIPQKEDNTHNTLVEYFPYKDGHTLRQQYKELNISYVEPGENKPEAGWDANGTAGQIIHTDREIMSEEVLRGSGFLAVRAMQKIEKGDLLYLRRFPRESF